MSVVNRENDTTEFQLPDNTIYCGVLSSFQNDQAQRFKFSSASSTSNGRKIFLIALVAVAFGCFVLSPS